MSFRPANEIQLNVVLGNDPANCFPNEAYYDEGFFYDGMAGNSPVSIAATKYFPQEVRLLAIYINLTKLILYYIY